MDAKSLIEEALRELGHEGLANDLKWRVNSERTIYSIDVYGVPPDVAKVIREKLEPWIEARMLTLVPKIVKAMRGPLRAQDNSQAAHLALRMVRANEGRQVPRSRHPSW